MKQMIFPHDLRILEVQIESLDKSFLKGVRQHNNKLEHLTIKFGRLDNSESSAFKIETIDETPNCL